MSDERYIDTIAFTDADGAYRFETYFWSHIQALNLALLLIAIEVQYGAYADRSWSES